MRNHDICNEILMISLGRFGPPKGPRHKPLTPPRDPKRALLGPRAPAPPLLTRTKFRVFCGSRAGSVLGRFWVLSKGRNRTLTTVKHMFLRVVLEPQFSPPRAENMIFGGPSWPPKLTFSDPKRDPRPPKRHAKLDLSPFAKLKKQ